MAQRSETLLDLARVIRSKNAGPFEVTFDIMFDDPAKYERVKKAGVINAARIAEIYGVRMDDVLVCRPYDPAVAFKVTIRRPVGSGDVQDRDVYGCQQHVPLMAIEVPVSSEGVKASSGSTLQCEGGVPESGRAMPYASV